MSKIVEKGDSIEGSKITGTSRKPVEYKGAILEKGRKIHKFMSRFNTKASIAEELVGNEVKIVDSASTKSLDEVVCDDAFLRSVEKKFSTDLQSNASATHGASAWNFPRQTNVMIVKSHEEIANGISKRLAAEQKRIEKK